MLFVPTTYIVSLERRHLAKAISRDTGPAIGMFTHFDALAMLIPNMGTMFYNSKIFANFLTKKKKESSAHAWRPRGDD